MPERAYWADKEETIKKMPESLLTPQELATWLKMSRVWVYKQAERGLIPFHRVGEAIRFDPIEIRAYLESCRSLKRTYAGCRNGKGRKRQVTSCNTSSRSQITTDISMACDPSFSGVSKMFPSEVIKLTG